MWVSEILYQVSIFHVIIIKILLLLILKCTILSYIFKLFFFFLLQIFEVLTPLSLRTTTDLSSMNRTYNLCTLSYY